MEKLHTLKIKCYGPEPFQIYQSHLTGPPMPYKVHESAMITTSDGKGVILSGGYNGYYGSNPLDNIIELREQ